MTLREAFYRSYDRSFLEEQCQTLITGRIDPTSFRRLGEGQHFTAWRASSALSQDDLVVRIPVKIDTQENPKFRAWQNAMQVIANSRLPLIPPFEFMQVESIKVLVSPLGNLRYSTLASHWNPIAMRTFELKNHLQSLGLKIDDFVQLAYWRNIPFIYDLSDLQFV